MCARDFVSSGSASEQCPVSASVAACSAVLVLTAVLVLLCVGVLTCAAAATANNIIDVMGENLRIGKKRGSRVERLPRESIREAVSGFTRGEFAARNTPSWRTGCF